MGKEIEIESTTALVCVTDLGSRGLDVPYLGYVETCLRVPGVLLLIVPDSVHTLCSRITLGTLHIDMAIKLATKKELGNLNNNGIEV